MGVKLVNGRTGNADLDWLHRTVARLAQQAQLPMPEVGYYESPEVNAFATGPSRSRSLVAVSSGLLRGMRQEEVEGVLAHELAHIKNGDMVTMTLIQGVVNAFGMFLSRIIASIVRNALDERYAYLVSMIVTIVLDIVFSILGAMIVAWFSRAREFRADAGGAALAGRGKMIAALRRLQSTKMLVDNSAAGAGDAEDLGRRRDGALRHPPAARGAHPRPSGTGAISATGASGATGAVRCTGAVHRCVRCGCTRRPHTREPVHLCT